MEAATNSGLHVQGRLGGVHKGAILSARFNSDGNYLLSCGNDRSVRLWNPHKGMLLKTYAGHSQAVHTAAAASDNTRIVSAGADRTPLLWDVPTAQIIRRFKGHSMRINVATFACGSTLLATGSDDRSVRLFDLRGRSNDAIDVLLQASDSVQCLAIFQNFIFSGSVDGSIRVYDVRMGMFHSDDCGSSVTSLDLSKDGKCMLVSCTDGWIRMLERASGELLNMYSGHGACDVKLEARLTGDDRHVLCGDAKGRMHIWDLVENERHQAIDLNVGDRAVTALASHPSMPMAAAGVADGDIILLR